jgi:ketosteroid isomerase-like protein
VADEMADRIALQERFNRFADALDRKQFDLLDGFFTDDAVGEFKDRAGTMDFEITGAENIVGFARKMIGSDEIATQHLMGNFSATIDGDAAFATVRMRNYHHGVGPRAGLSQESVGHYAGRFRRTGEGWQAYWWQEEIYINLGDAALFAPETGNAG